MAAALSVLLCLLTAAEAKLVLDGGAPKGFNTFDSCASPDGLPLPTLANEP